MANKKISDYTAATAIADADLLEIETAGGNSRKVTGLNARLSLAKVYYSGSTTTKTYDPGTTLVALDSCSVSIPASSSSRVFKVEFYWKGSTSFSSSHGVRSVAGLDGAAATGMSAQGWSPAISGENVFCVGMGVVTVPGDSAAHTIDLIVADSGATGNLTFLDRYIFAQQIA